jgi:surfeit locus 1 family protein
MASRRFSPSLWSTLAAIAGIAATVALGYWQLGRAQQKTDLLIQREAAMRQEPIHLGSTTVDPRSIEGRRVEARGRFDERGMVLLDNRVRSGRVGYDVVMPLRLDGSTMHVLVNRGWVTGTGDRARLPSVKTPEGEVHIVGIAVEPGLRVYELSEQQIEGQVWQNLTVERYRAHTNYAIQPIMIQQTNDTGDGLLRVWPTPTRSIAVHRSYALQWFSLAVLIAVAYIGFAFRRVVPKH